MSLSIWGIRNGIKAVIRLDQRARRRPTLPGRRFTDGSNIAPINHVATQPHPSARTQGASRTMCGDGPEEGQNAVTAPLPHAMAVSTILRTLSACGGIKGVSCSKLHIWTFERTKSALVPLYIRPSLQQETVSVIQDLVSAGKSVSQAAKHRGIGRSTAYRVIRNAA